MIVHVVDAVPVSVVDAGKTLDLVHAGTDALLFHICPGEVASLQEIYTCGIGAVLVEVVHQRIEIICIGNLVWILLAAIAVFKAGNVDGFCNGGYSVVSNLNDISACFVFLVFRCSGIGRAVGFI